MFDKMKLAQVATSITIKPRYRCTKEFQRAMACVTAHFAITTPSGRIDYADIHIEAPTVDEALEKAEKLADGYLSVSEGVM